MDNAFSSDIPAADLTSPLRLPIDPAFRAFVGSTAERFGYLHPEFTVVDHGEFVELSGTGDPLAAVRDFRYTLYREKIHTEGQPLRDAMLRGLVG